MKAVHVTLKLLGLFIALLSTRMAWADPLNDIDDQKNQLSFNQTQNDENDQKVLEVISTQTGKTLLKLALALEVSNNAFSQKTLPLEIVRTKIESEKLRDKLSNGIGTIITGDVLIVAGIVLRNIHKFSSLQKYFRNFVLVHKIGVGSFASGCMISVYGSVTTDNANTELNDYNQKTHFPLLSAIGPRVELAQYLEFWSSLLDLSSDEKEQLSYHVWNTFYGLINRITADHDLSSVNLHEVNILKIMKENKIGAPEKIAALERLLPLLQKKLANEPALTQPVHRAFVETQLQELRSFHETLSRDYQGISSNKKFSKNFLLEVLTEAREEQEELQSALDALPTTAPAANPDK